MNQPNPYQAPTAPLQTGGQVEGDRAYLLLVAKYQKAILLCILANILGAVLQFALPGPLKLVAACLQLLISVTSVVFVVLLAKTVYSVVAAVVYALLAFVPCVGLIALFVINQKATSVLQKGGLKVGLLGADLSSLQ
jgi:hypothetical protein